MKKIVIACIIVAAATLAYGEVLLEVISSYTVHNDTRYTQSVVVSPNKVIAVRTTSAVCSMYANDALGTGYLLAANTEYIRQIPRNTTNVVFKCDTTATIFVTR